MVASPRCQRDVAIAKEGCWQCQRTRNGHKKKTSSKIFPAGPLSTSRRTPRAMSLLRILDAVSSHVGDEVIIGNKSRARRRLIINGKTPHAVRRQRGLGAGGGRGRGLVNYFVVCLEFKVSQSDRGQMLCGAAARWGRQRSVNSEEEKREEGKGRREVILMSPQVRIR